MCEKGTEGPLTRGDPKEDGGTVRSGKTERQGWGLRPLGTLRETPGEERSHT